MKGQTDWAVTEHDRIDMEHKIGRCQYLLANSLVFAGARLFRS
jgi:hypothetical protein